MEATDDVRTAVDPAAVVELGLLCGVVVGMGPPEVDASMQAVLFSDLCKSIKTPHIRGAIQD